MLTELEELRRKLEEKVLLKRPYKEIYQASRALDKAINQHYIKNTLMIRKKQ